jgi:hypothetical protein
VFLAPSSFDNLPSHLPRVWGQVALSYLIPTFGTHRVLSPKTTLTMPPRRVSQYLHPDEGLPQTSNQNQPSFQQPSTQTLSTITEAVEHPTFDNNPEVQLLQANMSTTTASTSQGNGCEQHLNTNPPLPPLQVNQGKAEFNQIKVQDWDEAEEEEAEPNESELIRVQQDMERLRQEQESIMRR